MGYFAVLNLVQKVKCVNDLAGLSQLRTVLHVLSSNTLEVYIRSKLSVGYQGQILRLQT